MIVRITFLVIIKNILKWAENILRRNKLAGKKNTISKQTGLWWQLDCSLKQDNSHYPYFRKTGTQLTSFSSVELQ